LVLAHDHDGPRDVFAGNEHPEFPLDLGVCLFAGSHAGLIQEQHGLVGVALVDGRGHRGAAPSHGERRQGETAQKLPRHDPAAWFAAPRHVPPDGSYRMCPSIRRAFFGRRRAVGVLHDHK
jgi:hypothetical protein